MMEITHICCNLLKYSPMTTRVVSTITAAITTPASHNGRHTAPQRAVQRVLPNAIRPDIDHQLPSTSAPSCNPRRRAMLTGLATLLIPIHRASALPLAPLGRVTSNNDDKLVKPDIEIVKVGAGLGAYQHTSSQRRTSLQQICETASTLSQGS